MSVHVLRCPNCGAELDVVEGAQAIRCRFCGARCRVEGSGGNAKLSPEEEAAWNELIDQVKSLDLDAIEENLAQLQQAYEEKQKSEVWEALAESLSGHDDLDQLAQTIVNAGNGKSFLTQLDKMPMKGGIEYKAVRQVMDRLATKIAVLMANRTESEQGLVQSNLLAQSVKVRAAEELIARAELEQAAAGLERTRIEAGHRETNQNVALALRRQYRMSRVWAVVGFPFLTVCVGAVGLGLAAWNPADWVVTVGRVLFWGSPFVALYSSSMKWGRGTEAGRRFNELAPLFGLPQVAAKSKSEHEAAKGCTHEAVGGCGCLAFLAVAIGFGAAHYFGFSPFAETTQPPTNAPATNEQTPPASDSIAPSGLPAGGGTANSPD